MHRKILKTLYLFGNQLNLNKLLKINIINKILHNYLFVYIHKSEKYDNNPYRDINPNNELRYSKIIGFFNLKLKNMYYYLLF